MAVSPQTLTVLQATGDTAVSRAWAVDYDLIAPVTATRAVAYDILAGVSRAWAVDYDFGRVVSVSNAWAVDYDILAPVSSATALTYDILTGVARAWAVDYDINAPISRAWAVDYDIGATGPPAGDLLLLWLA